ncbi:MAG: enoyl-CoA hydratase/isomerase family protein [Parvularculaceae bacterium]|nr:enoyl-CoA hydratase/isomerase family protein [Parvularculaceae bacterium]
MSIESTTVDGVATITINRPEKKNAITLAMRTEIESAFQAAQDDHNVRAIILTGAGVDFSAGADVGEMGGGGVRQSLLRMRHLHRMARSVANTNKPVIAAVRGVCIGMSWALALACDVVVTAHDARFQFAFRHIGLAPDGGAAFLLTRYLGVQRAKEIIYSGRFVSGDEAAALGLALHALQGDEVMAKAQELAQNFANAPTLALMMAKRQFDAAPGQNYDQALDFEANIQPLMVETEDNREGILSFKEKRKPGFVGN